MEVRISSELRKNWRDDLMRVYTDDVALAVTYGKGQAEVVVMSHDTWATGERRVPVPESKRSMMGSLAVRDNLREVRETVLREGMHVLITRWGKPQQVIAPFTWTQQALPELGEPEYGVLEPGERAGRRRANVELGWSTAAEGIESDRRG
ncbi:hypothetical protein [Nocardia brasiliensis]|uniref:hypothetical protein n=1 Tax=Nocardia brasiliensis TaxID=37326 RepID=UPI003D944074